MSLLQRMERLPNWLRQAVLVGQVPDQLDTSQLTPVIETGQGGWGDNDVRYFDTTSAGAALQFTILQNTVNEAALVLGARVISSVFSAAFNANIVIVPPTASSIVAGSASFAAAGFKTWKDLMGAGDARLYIPPGGSFIIGTDTPGAGDTVQVIGYYLKLRAGYNPF